MGKSNAAASRALLCLLRVVAWALPTELTVCFPSQAINRVVFSWAKPTLRLGERSSEIIGLRFSDDLFIFKTTYDYIFKLDYFYW